MPQPSRGGTGPYPPGWWTLRVNLSGSKLGPAYRHVDLSIDDDPEWPPERMRAGAAEHFGVPLEQVGEPDFIREPVIPDPADFDDLDDALPIIGYCSKCGEAREADYTCRDGGRTVPREEAP